MKYSMMMSFVFAAMMFSWTGLSQAAESGAESSASVLMEKGLYEEETKGDVGAAIEIYQEIIENSKANQMYVAQAHYRMGMCYLKKNQPQEALKAFDLVISDYPEQKQVLADAIERRKETLKKLGLDEVGEIVKKAVSTISTCAEGDPRVIQAMAKLKGLDQKTVVEQLVPYLNYEKAEMRRSAIYILWKGEFDNIDPAADKLIELCSHPIALTRGMATLALGQHKVAKSYDILAKMTLEDSDGYARR